MDILLRLKSLFTPRIHNNNSPLKIVVVGNPRSGTSFVTGLIHQMGFSLGIKKNIKQPDQYNIYGYFEHLGIMRINSKIFKKLKIDFHYNLPEKVAIKSNALRYESLLIEKLINEEKIELIKDNRIIVMPDLYNELFPNSKWIYIQRNIEETYKSRFGYYISKADWYNIVNKREEIWNNSYTKHKSLSIDYNDFKIDFRGTISTIAHYLDITIDDSMISRLQAYYKPKKHKK